MNTFYTIRFVKASMLIAFLSIGFMLSAQISPYTLSPKWMFGYYAGLDFTGGAPVFLNGNQSYAAEASTSICDPSKNLILYSPGKELWAPGAATATLSGIGGASSTEAAIAVPDPSDATFTRYYFFTANDNTGGANIGGINYYLVTKTGPTTLSASGITNIAATNTTDESICAGTDGAGGYWIVSHVASAAQLYVWHVTTAGVGARTTINVPGGVVGSTSNGSMKFSLCQDRIGWYTNDGLEVFNWNRTTGTLGALVRRATGLGANVTYGFEFSPNGNMAYYTNLSAAGAITPFLKQIDLGTGTITPLATASSNASSNEIGTMQLGPDGKIYVANGAWFPSACNLGVISSPNTSGAPGYSGTAFVMPSTAAPNGWPPFTYRGIANIAWLSPKLVVSLISGDNTCSIKVGMVFQNYFLEDVDINTIEWDVNGDGTYESTYDGQTSPTIDYSPFPSATYTVRVRFKDNKCSQTWTGTTTVHSNCPMPVDWLLVSADVVSDGVNISWATASELNTSYFVVQRSLDGREFTDIGTVAAAGNSNVVREYSLKDLTPYVGASYYRIVQYDVDGKSTSSRIVAVNLSSVSLKVFPNPTAGQFELELSGAGQAQLTLTDVLGRVVYESTLQGDYVNTRFGDDLGKGTYVLTVVTPTKTIHEKLVKE